MKTVLDKKAIQVATVASPHTFLAGSNPILGCVLIGNGKILATDGYLLAARKIVTVPETGEPILLKAHEILKLQKQWKSKLLTISSNGNSASITDENGNITELELVQGAYPDYKKSLSKGKEKVYISLNLQFLKKAIKIIGRSDDDYVGILVWGSQNPIELFTRDTREFLMPAFGEKKESDVQF